LYTVSIKKQGEKRRTDVIDSCSSFAARVALLLAPKLAAYS
jgi:hypothetical protein